MGGHAHSWWGIDKASFWKRPISCQSIQCRMRPPFCFLKRSCGSCWSRQWGAGPQVMWIIHCPLPVSDDAPPGHPVTINSLRWPPPRWVGLVQLDAEFTPHHGSWALTGLLTVEWWWRAGGAGDLSQTCYSPGFEDPRRSNPSSGQGMGVLWYTPGSSVGVPHDVGKDQIRALDA